MLSWHVDLLHTKLTLSCPPSSWLEFQTPVTYKRISLLLVGKYNLFLDVLTWADRSATECTLRDDWIFSKQCYIAHKLTTPARKVKVSSYFHGKEMAAHIPKFWAGHGNIKNIYGNAWWTQPYEWCIYEIWNVHKIQIQFMTVMPPPLILCIFSWHRWTKFLNHLVVRYATPSGLTLSNSLSIWVFKRTKLQVMGRMFYMALTHLIALDMAKS